MHNIIRSGACLLSVVAFVAACSQQDEPAPTPITAEPVFDKYGSPSCRPESQPIDSTYKATLPTCEDVCREPTMYPGTAMPLVCPPPPPDRGRTPGDDDDDRRPTRDPIPGTAPTRG